MASKKQQASSSGAPTPQQGPSPRSTAMLGTLRLVALMGATIVALVVFEALETPIGFWPALCVGFVSGIVARAVLFWLERVWLRAAARRAAAREAGRDEQPRTRGKSGRT